jgi:hypothetical protein
MKKLIFFILISACLETATSAQQSSRGLSEAPAGFDTPNLVQNPGSESSSNGIIEPPGDSFALDQQVYETIHDVNDGLGPLFNGRTCAQCHANPVSGVVCTP